MKRSLSIALILCLLATLFVGFSSAIAEEKIPLRYYMPGSDKLIDPAVIQAVNDKMAADGLNLDLQPIYIPWDAWVDKINLMLATGEEFEMFQIMCDYIPFNTYQGRGALQPLNDLIAEYGPNLVDLFSQEIWDCTVVDGEKYIIPAEWRDASGDIQGLLSVRQDKLDAAGLSMSDETLTVDTMIDTLSALQAAWDSSVTPYVWDHSKTRPPITFQRMYDSWPFYSSLDGLFFVDQAGVVKPYFETEEFAQDCAIYARMYEAGLVHPDILSIPQDTKNTMSTNGDILGGIDTFQEDGEPTLKMKIPEADVAMYRPNPEKPVLMSMPLLNANAIPNTTPHPEAGVQFLNWLYESKENHDLLIYGIEGTHYTQIDEKYIKTNTNPETSEPLHRFDYWMIGNRQYTFYEEGTPQGVIDDWSGCTMEYVVSPVTGFNFNSEPVKVEYAQVQAEYDAVILPIKLGVVDYAENIDAALANMKAAGIETVVAEYQAQLDAFVASK